MIGDIVYYKTLEAPQRFFPAIVTNDHGKWVSLTVFPEDAVPFSVTNSTEEADTAGCFQLKPPTEGPEPEPVGMLIVLTNPHQHPLEAVGREDLASAGTVIAVDPDGSHRTVKQRGFQALKVAVKSTSKRARAQDYAKSFLERVGLGDDIETRLTDWFEAAMNGEAP